MIQMILIIIFHIYHTLKAASTDDIKIPISVLVTGWNILDNSRKVFLILSETYTVFLEQISKNVIREPSDFYEVNHCVD
jgi:thioredoxin-related protein